MFSDNQLEWLKKNLREGDRTLNRYGWFLDMQEWLALIERLEAAEFLILNNERTLEEETPNLVEAWHKAAGK